MAMVAFLIAYSLIFPLAAGETQRNYSRLLAAWNSPSISLVELRDISSKVGGQSRDEDLQFVAKHLMTTASLWSDLGYARLGDIKTSSKIEYFGRSFLQGYDNPAINLKSIPLWWNAKKFEQAAELLDSRNKRRRLLRWAMSGGIAFVMFCFVGGKQRIKAKVKRTQYEPIQFLC